MNLKMDEEFVPKWDLIVKSQIWQKQIEPWLRAAYMDALAEKSGPKCSPIIPGGNPATLEDYHFWRGVCHAISRIRSVPYEEVAAARIQREQEEDAIVRQQEQYRRTKPEY